MNEREVDKLQKSLGGIQEMAGIPEAIFVVDIGYHKIALTEAKKLGIPALDARNGYNTLIKKSKGEIIFLIQSS